MLNDGEVRALELKGLTYYRANGRDYAFHLPTVFQKAEELKRHGLRLISLGKGEAYRKNLYMIVPEVNDGILTALPIFLECYKGKVELCSVDPLNVELFYEPKIFSAVDRWSADLQIHTLDLSDAYWDMSFVLLHRLARCIGHQKEILSSTLDKPDIESLVEFFYRSYVREIDFTDFTGKYLHNTSGMFENTSVNKIVWAHPSLHNVEDMNCMFKDARNLTYVNLSSVPQGAWSFKAFRNTALPQIYKESNLRDGSLQEWCRKQEEHLC